MLAWQLLVEDSAGETLSLSLEQFPGLHAASFATIDTIFPVGTVLAIREPAVMLRNADTLITYIRLDSPSNLIFLRPSDPLLRNVSWNYPQASRSALPRTAYEWKLLGNNFFKDGQHFAAAFAFSEGLATDPTAYILALNRSAAYLRLEHFSAVLADATSVLAVESITPDQRLKALFRSAQAQYGLSCYRVALEGFKCFLSLSPEYIEVKEWIMRCQDRISESEAGIYDWVRLFKDAQKKGTKMDVADFVGSVNIGQSSRGGGRGIVATRDVKVGELLVRPYFIYPMSVDAFR